MKLSGKLFVMCGLLAWAVGSHAQKSLSTPQSQMEKLDRGYPGDSVYPLEEWYACG